MTTSKKATGRKAEIKKLKLKKETIRDLDVQNKARGVRGGGSGAVRTCLSEGPFCYVQK